MTPWRTIQNQSLQEQLLNNKQWITFTFGLQHESGGIKPDPLFAHRRSNNIVSGLAENATSTALELEPLPLHRLGPWPGLLQRRIQTLDVDGAGARFAKIIANQQLLSLSLAQAKQPSNGHQSARDHLPRSDVCLVHQAAVLITFCGVIRGSIFNFASSPTLGWHH